MKCLRILFLIIFAAAAIVLAVRFYEHKNLSYAPASNSTSPSPDSQNNIPEDEITKTADQALKDFIPPLDNAKSRITKKPFGIHITSATSPVQPERFAGYHTGADFEIFPDELNQEVAVKAICQGKLLLKKYANGYGGVAIESCLLDQQPVTVIYGHLKLGSIEISPGQNMEAGSFLGILGKNNSAETDGERKHLHLGIHKGSAINLLGYVNSKSGLSAWIDPGSLIFKN